MAKQRKISRVNHALSGSRSGGFTLLEVLVAVAIFSIIVAALYSTFFLSHRAVDAVDDSLLRLQEARAVLDTIKREIESALYDDARKINNKPYTVFKVDDRDFYGKQASQLLFTSFSPLVPGLAKITYTVEENDGKLTLKKKIVSAYAQKEETKSVELMEEIESFTLEVKYGDRWVKTWDSAQTSKLPAEVRISVKVAARKERNPTPQGTFPDAYTISDIAKPRYENPI